MLIYHKVVRIFKKNVITYYVIYSLNLFLRFWEFNCIYIEKIIYVMMKNVKSLRLFFLKV
jgi:hypothetical protein